MIFFCIYNNNNHECKSLAVTVGLLKKAHYPFVTVDINEKIYKLYRPLLYDPRHPTNDANYLTR